MFEHTYIGLDVHAQSIVGCAMNTQTGEVFREKMASDPVAVRSWIQRFDAPVRVVYEAGPTGFGLGRYLVDAGIDCVIAAPSKLLRAPGDHVKTDRRDAMALAHMLSLGEIVPVRVPSPDQEALRDLSRARATAAKELAHSRQRINALLLRKGLHYPEKTHWTQAHIAWLNRQHFDQRPAQLTLEADVELQILQLQHLKSLEQHIMNLVPDCEYFPVINALMCFRGIQLTTGFGLAVEVGDWTRFTGASIGAYLGLTPCEHSSGKTRSQGPITKAGNTYARRLLIEAAWLHQRPYTRPGVRLLRQFDLVDPATRTRAMEGNHRLHHQWERFEARGKRRTKANTAIARELAGWCWSVAAPLQNGATMSTA